MGEENGAAEGLTNRALSGLQSSRARADRAAPRGRRIDQGNGAEIRDRLRIVRLETIEQK
jgi:hypothetical protein